MFSKHKFKELLVPKYHKNILMSNILFANDKIWQIIISQASFDAQN